MPEGALAAAALIAALVAPHALRLERVTPARAATVWLAALALRATLITGGALLALAKLPGTSAFDLARRATVHEPLPAVAWHPDIPGDAFAHAGALLPAAAIAGSLLLLAAGRLLARRRLRARLVRTGLGAGPCDSLVVADARILAGVPRVGPGRVLVSHAALAALDRAELEATLAHELGHLRRRHRPLELGAACLACVGRLVPGTSAAARRLGFALERDADDYAVRHTGDPLALASAICKAAAERPSPQAGLGLAGENAQARVEKLLAGGRPQANRALERTSVALAGVLGLLTASLLGALASIIGPRPGVLFLAIACGG